MLVFRLAAWALFSASIVLGPFIFFMAALAVLVAVEAGIKELEAHENNQTYGVTFVESGRTHAGNDRKKPR
jgi:hypothetical protein